MRKTLVLALAGLLAAGTYGFIEGKPHANACRGFHVDAGGGNGSETGDPGNSGLHNNGAISGTNSQSPASQADPNGEDNL